MTRQRDDVEYPLDFSHVVAQELGEDVVGEQEISEEEQEVHNAPLSNREHDVRV